MDRKTKIKISATERKMNDFKVKPKKFVTKAELEALTNKMQPNSPKEKKSLLEKDLELHLGPRTAPPGLPMWSKTARSFYVGSR